MRARGPSRRRTTPRRGRTGPSSGTRLGRSGRAARSSRGRAGGAPRPPPRGPEKRPPGRSRAKRSGLAPPRRPQRRRRRRVAWWRMPPRTKARRALRSAAPATRCGDAWTWRQPQSRPSTTPQVCRRRPTPSSSRRVRARPGGVSAGREVSGARTLDSAQRVFFVASISHHNDQSNTTWWARAGTCTGMDIHM